LEEKVRGENMVSFRQNKKIWERKMIPVFIDAGSLKERELDERKKENLSRKEDFQ
jgi:hypothetical protein